MSVFSNSCTKTTADSKEKHGNVIYIDFNKLDINKKDPVYLSDVRSIVESNSK